jgi:hypothetical protein
MYTILTIWMKALLVLFKDIKNTLRGDGLLTAYYLLLLLP